MSSNGHMFYGYGICTSELGVTSTERIDKLLTFAPEYRKEIHDYFKREGISTPTVNDYLDANIKEDYGFATVLKKVIEEAMNIYFTSCQNDDNEKTYLIYPENLPWKIPVREQSLTEELVKKILLRFASIITDKELTVEYQKVPECF